MTQAITKYLPLAGFKIQSRSAADLFAELESRIQRREKTALLFANTNFALQCQSQRDWINSSAIILVNDGIGLDIAAKLIHGERYQANLNGTDFVPYLLKSLQSPQRVFLFGGKPGVAEKAARIIESTTCHQVVGCKDGYGRIPSSKLQEIINQTNADIVLVAMGNPLQEQWIQENMPALNAALFIGVGALFDFMSGGVQRAPQWVQRIRMEWMFRLMQEPRRLAKRYSVDIIRFLVACIRYRD